MGPWASLPRAADTHRWALDGPQSQRGEAEGAGI